MVFGRAYGRRWWLVGAALGTAAGPALARQGAPTLADPNPLAVYRIDQVAPFLRAAATRRVDLAIIGDSNVRFNTTSGHEDGMGRGFAQALGLYATRVDPVTGINSWGAEIFLSQTTQNWFPWTGAPAGPAAVYMIVEAGFPGGYGYLAAGQTASFSNNNGLGIDAAHPIDITGPLRWHITHYAFGPGAAGFFTPTIREQWPGNAAHNYSAPVAFLTAGDVPGFVDVFVDAPAGARTNDGVLCCLTDYATGQGAAGPFFAQWYRVENRAHTSGIAYSPLLYQGGRSARNACDSLLFVTTDVQMREWLRQVTRLQNGAPTLMVQILHGGNDLNDHLPSLGPVGGLDSSTPAGQEDNTRGIIGALRAYWTQAGYDPANLYFLLGPYHPQTDQVTELAAYEDHWRLIADTTPNVGVIAGTRLSTPEEFAANFWYDFRGNAHLSVEGYHAWGTGAVTALMRAMWLDVDGNRVINIDDLYAWYAHPTDTDGNGVIDDADEAFLERWLRSGEVGSMAPR